MKQMEFPFMEFNEYDFRNRVTRNPSVINPIKSINFLKNLEQSLFGDHSLFYFETLINKNQKKASKMLIFYDHCFYFIQLYALVEMLTCLKRSF